MKKLFIAVAALPLFGSLACAGPDLDDAADDICDCLEEPYEQVSKAMELVKQAQASGDMSQLMAAQGEMMAVITASGQCFDALSKKYPEIEKSDPLKKEVMAIAEKQCPNPMPMNR